MATESNQKDLWRKASLKVNCGSDEAGREAHRIPCCVYDGSRRFFLVINPFDDDSKWKAH